MEKIPTLFERDDSFHVIDKVRVGCEWVLAGEGEATEKLDGTNIRLTLRNGKCVRLEKRRNPTKKQKQAGIKHSWYVDADEQDRGDRWIFQAASNTSCDWPDGEHCAEAIGPKIQGNPLSLTVHMCVLFNECAPKYEIGRTFTKLKTQLENLDSRYSPGNLAEGIVFHHPDGRRAKIKRKDFG